MPKKRYFRNKIQLTSKEGIEVDRGSLWIQKDKKELILVDDDQYATTELSTEFVEVKI